jgi:hypothetical protein
MQNKTLIAVVAALVLLTLGYLLISRSNNPAAAPAVAPHGALTTQALSKQPAVTATSGPTFKMGTPVAVPASAQFDSAEFTSTSKYPVITGTANVPKVGIIVNNAAGTGLMGSDISVIDGHWSYRVSVALKRGTYTVVLSGGEKDASATLTVQ